MKNKDKDNKYWETLAASQAEKSFELYLQEYEENKLKANIFGYDADQIQAMKEKGKEARTKDIESYRKGFKHGLDMKDGIFYHVFGYPVMEVLDLIQQHEEKKMKELTRAEAEATLKKLNVPKDITGEYYILTLLEALGLIKFKKEPDLSEIQKALCAIMTEIEVRQGSDYGKITPGYISAYGSGCIINGLMGKGYKIVLIT